MLAGDTITEVGSPTVGDLVAGTLIKTQLWLEQYVDSPQGQLAMAGLALLKGGPLGLIGGYALNEAVSFGLSTTGLDKQVSNGVTYVGAVALSVLSSVPLSQELSEINGDLGQYDYEPGYIGANQEASALVGAGITILGLTSLAALGAGSIGRFLSNGGGSGATKFLQQGFTQAQAEYLAGPYDGVGHHFIPRRFGLPSVITDSPLSILSPTNISRGDFYELHYRVDPYFYGTAFPIYIGGSWSGSALGLQKYGTLGTLWYGSPTPLKA